MMPTKLFCIGLLSMIGVSTGDQSRALNWNGDAASAASASSCECEVTVEQCETCASTGNYTACCTFSTCCIAVDSQGSSGNWGGSNGDANVWGGGSTGGNGGGSTWGGSSGGVAAPELPKPKPAPKPKAAMKIKPAPKAAAPKPKPAPKKPAPKPKAVPSGGSDYTWGSTGSWGGEWKNATVVSSGTPTASPIDVAPRPTPTSRTTPQPTRISAKSDDAEACDCPNDFTSTICENCLTGNGFCNDKTCALECCEVKSCQCKNYDSSTCNNCLGSGNSNKCPDKDCAEACCNSYSYTAEGDSYKDKKEDTSYNSKNDKYGYDANGSSYKTKSVAGSSNAASSNVLKYSIFAILVGSAIAAVAYAAARYRRADPSAAGDQESALKRVMQRKKGGKLDQEMEMGQTEYVREA